jgi:large conductance mechanosensitive channel
MQMSKSNKVTDSAALSKVTGAAKSGKKAVGGFFDEFKTFALKGNVMSMAVGVLIGGAFSSLVTSLTDNIITPILNCFGSVDDSEVANLAIKINGQTLQFGAFIADVINFLIMAFIVFLLVKGMNTLGELGKKEEAPAAPTTKKCPYCQSEIDIKATKCPHCTSDLPN